MEHDDSIKLLEGPGCCSNYQSCRLTIYRHESKYVAVNCDGGGYRFVGIMLQISSILNFSQSYMLNFILFIVTIPYLQIKLPINSKRSYIAT